MKNLYAKHIVLTKGMLLASIILVVFAAVLPVSLMLNGNVYLAGGCKNLINGTGICSGANALRLKT